MANLPKILVFAGSTRKDSFNKKLARLAEAELKRYPLSITYLDLKDLPMPLYDGDLEAEKGIPENGMKFRALLNSHQAFLIVSPEYNSSISGVLKNAIDWASRPLPDESYLQAYTGKVVGLMSASPTQWGGLRGLVTLRSILGNIGSHVLPDQFCLSFADKAFKPDGQLADEKLMPILKKCCAALVKVATALTSEVETPKVRA